MTGLIVTILVIGGSVFAIGLFAMGMLSLVVATAIGGLARASIAPVDLDESGEDWECASSHHDWAGGRGFEWLDSFSLAATGNPPAVILAWRRPTTGTYFCVYRIKPTSMPLITAFDLITIIREGESSVTTGSMPEALTLPQPKGEYVECLPDVSLDHRLAAHDLSVRYVCDSLGVKPEPPETPFEELFAGAMKRQADHVRSHALWQFRLLYWNSRRMKNVGKTVRERYPDLSRQRRMVARR